MMSLTFGLFTQVSGSGPLGPLVLIIPHDIHSLSKRKVGCVSYGNIQKHISSQVHCIDGYDAQYTVVICFISISSHEVQHA